MEERFYKEIRRHALEPKFELIKNKKAKACFEEGIWKQHVRRRTTGEVTRVRGDVLGAFR